MRFNTSPMSLCQSPPRLDRISRTISHRSIDVRKSNRYSFLHHSRAASTPEYGIAKIVYAESLPVNQTRFYLVVSISASNPLSRLHSHRFQFLNGTQLLTRCDFFLYYPGVANLGNGTGGLYSIYLDRNVFVAQPIALADGLAQLWTNQNPGVQAGILYIQLQNQMQYICVGG